MERVKQILQGIKAALGTAWKFTGKIPYMRLVLLAVILVLVIIGFYNCGSGQSQLEKDLEEKKAEQIEQQAETTVAAEEIPHKEAEVKVRGRKVEEARSTAKKAVKAAEEKRNDDSGDVTYEQANSSRCKAYPGDKECQ